MAIQMIILKVCFGSQLILTPYFYMTDSSSFISLYLPTQMHQPSFISSLVEHKNDEAK